MRLVAPAVTAPMWKLRPFHSTKVHFHRRNFWVTLLGWTSQERPFTGTFTGSNWVLAPRQAPLSFIEFAAVYTKTQSGISFVFYKCHNTTCAVYLVFLNTLMCRQTQLAAVEPKNATWAKLHNCTLRVVEHCLSPPMSPPASFFSLRIYCFYSLPG